jgi:hypothetical protein
MQNVFTPEQATRMLPLVRRIVRDIVDYYAQWQRAVGEFEMATAGLRADAPSPEAEALQRQVQRLAAEIERFRLELESLGVQLKGFDQGLVDFPSERDGRPILLCWKLDEPEVGFWHEAGAGFAGRQRLEVTSSIASLDEGQ